MTSFGVPDYLAAAGGPEAVFARARRAALADGEARRRAIVAAYASREPSGCHPSCLCCARGLPRDGLVHLIDGKPYAHVGDRRAGLG